MLSRFPSIVTAYFRIQKAKLPRAKRKNMARGYRCRQGYSDLIISLPIFKIFPLFFLSQANTDLVHLIQVATFEDFIRQTERSWGRTLLEKLLFLAHFILSDSATIQLSQTEFILATLGQI